MPGAQDGSAIRGGAAVWGGCVILRATLRYVLVTQDDYSTG